MRRLSDDNIHNVERFRLLIADGSQFQTWVYDLRRFGPWSVESAGVPLERPAPTIIYHHTASGAHDFKHRKQELQALELVANGSPNGLPYNFVVAPVAPFRVYYLNDIDRSWPHTLDHNGGVAICALGNFSVLEPRFGMVKVMWRLADALATMWGEYCPEQLHSETFPTECPGVKLAPMLRRW